MLQRQHWLLLNDSSDTDSDSDYSSSSSGWSGGEDDDSENEDTLRNAHKGVMKRGLGSSPTIGGMKKSMSTPNLASLAALEEPVPGVAKPDFAAAGSVGGGDDKKQRVKGTASAHAHPGHAADDDDVYLRTKSVKQDTIRLRAQRNSASLPVPGKKKRSGLGLTRSNSSLSSLNNFVTKKKTMEILRLKDKLTEMERKVRDQNKNERNIAKMLFDLKTERRDMERKVDTLEDAVDTKDRRIKQQEQQIQALLAECARQRQALEEQSVQIEFLQSMVPSEDDVPDDSEEEEEEDTEDEEEEEDDGGGHGDDGGGHGDDGDGE